MGATRLIGRIGMVLIIGVGGLIVARAALPERASVELAVGEIRISTGTPRPILGDWIMPDGVGIPGMQSLAETAVPLGTERAPETLTAGVPTDLPDGTETVPADTPTTTPTPTRTPSGYYEIPYQSVWRCATLTPVATECSDSGSCTRSESFATPYVLMNEFPPGAHVQRGPIGRSELGIWAWVELDGVYKTNSRAEDFAGKAWIAVWTVTIENTSSTVTYGFAPILTSRVEQVQLDDGTLAQGPWFFDPDATQEMEDANTLSVDFPFVSEWLDGGEDTPEEVIEERELVRPGEITSARLAAYVPGPHVTKVSYAFRDEDIIGVPHVWRTVPNEADMECRSEVTAGPEGFEGVPLMEGDASDVKLDRLPVEAGTISRGYGCTSEFTGVRGSGCPSGVPWFHNGVDIALPAGSAYYDAMGVSTIVNYAGIDSNGADCSSLEGAKEPATGLGRYVVHTGLINGHTVTIIAGHLSDFRVRTSDAAEPGEILGLTGSTGCSTAPHLHFSVLVDGQYINPLDVLPLDEY